MRGRSITINIMPFLLDDDGEGGFEREIVEDCNSTSPIDEDREVVADICMFYLYVILFEGREI